MYFHTNWNYIVLKDSHNLGFLYLYLTIPKVTEMCECVSLELNGYNKTMTSEIHANKIFRSFLGVRGVCNSFDWENETEINGQQRNVLTLKIGQRKVCSRVRSTFHCF